ncbi:NAD(+) diphosphatase [Aliiroseovarius subalbicans]|uniref:NAD(+) diphosphatase n=1 Tax=Aliiroseovarius subalbicans TaxID=2925840 RepID=UPI001F566D6D|nr:NAD(+) diphosphatase [Aliiroseovarius subalbicans]MCI2399425.1 NAD(+) diphosphatase [Aliiroseovarius subalbicans]
MQRAETVTFGGGGLDRAAHLRGDDAALAALLEGPDVRILPIWRGKPAVAGEEDQRLVKVMPGHAILADLSDPMVFLGQADGQAWFAADISAWEPEVAPADPTQFFDASEQHHPALSAGDRFAELRGVMAGLSPLEAELAATAKAILGWQRSHRFCAACGAASDMGQAGWQRSCPACGTQHFPRTDPVVIMLVTRGNAVLVGRSPGWPEGMYSLLAGFLEPGETVEAAVRREVFEEAGVQIGAVRYLASQPWPYPSSLMIGCHGEALSTQITLDPVELEDALWVTREEMLEVFAGRHPKIRPARKGAIAHFLLRNWLADSLE